MRMFRLMKLTYRFTLMFYVLFALAILSRFLPHPPNVAAVGALGLFAGCYLTGKKSWLLPVGVMLASDLLSQALGIPGMGLYHPLAMLGVYAGFAASAWIGSKVRRRISAQTVVAGSLTASLVFFLTSNFGVWLAGSFNSTSTDLLTCYLVAIPFFGATLAGDLFYSTLLFGSYELFRRRDRLSDMWGADRRLSPVKVRK